MRRAEWLRWMTARRMAGGALVIRACSESERARPVSVDEDESSRRSAAEARNEADIAGARRKISY